MSSDFLDTPIEFIKGVGPQRAAAMKSELNIVSIGDLLTHYPFRYIDRTQFLKIADIHEDLPFVQLRGKIIRLETLGKQRTMRLVATFSDGINTMELVWFRGIKWLGSSIQLNVEYVVFGKPTLFNGKYNIAHPEIERVSEENTVLASTMQPVYSTTEKLKAKSLDSKAIAKIIKALTLTLVGKIPENLSDPMVHQHHLISREQALINIHVHKNQDLLNKAQFRLKFEELFFIQLRLLRLKVIRNHQFKGFVFSKVGAIFNDFYTNHLPFELTGAQKRVIKEIRADMGSGQQMNRLLQGDVGSGKTLVALMSMFIALDNVFQACIIAPTEILATQHYESICDMV